MKKFRIETILASGIVMAIISIALLISVPYQIRIPGYDSGAPSPRIIPTICLVIMLIFSIVLIIQSLVFKKKSYYEFDWSKEKPALILILILCVYVALIIYLGYILASAITFIIVLFFCGERKIPVYIYTVVAAVLIYFLFKKVFNVSLPSGIIESLLGG